MEMLYLQAMSYSIEAGDFSSLATAWEELLSASATGHIYFTPQWQTAWWQAFGNDSELLLLSVQRDAEIIGIVPLMRQGERISFIGSSDVCDYMDFVVRQGQEVGIISQLLDYLEATDWNSIDLQSLLPHSIALSHFAPLARQRGYLVGITKEDVSPQLVLPSSWEEYLSQLKGKDRHELRRKLRRLDGVKPTRFYTITETGQLGQQLAGFFELFNLSGSKKVGFMTDQMRGFFEDMAHSLAGEGYIRLSFLEVGGQRVASTICFDCWGHYHLYNSGYNPAYASLSVGLLCKAFCIREGILEGKRRFDFLRGAEPYKYHLGAQDVPVYRCVISRG
jgi:CelD/BcsL family acetyltransferase involved in cellulose biosynthesis